MCVVYTIRMHVCLCVCVCVVRVFVVHILYVAYFVRRQQIAFQMPYKMVTNCIRNAIRGNFVSHTLCTSFFFFFFENQQQNVLTDECLDRVICNK